MHSAWTLVTLLLASSAPAVLGGKCNAPREAGENNNCLGGSYNDCVARNNQLCTGECFGQPAGGAGAPCYTGCTTRNQQYCAGYCMKISNCDDCIESLKQMGAAGSDEQHKETCSQEEPSSGLKCLRTLNIIPKAKLPLKYSSTPHPPVTSITLIRLDRPSSKNADEMTRWSSLPTEIRCMILETLTAHKSIAPYASVSTEWREFIEKKTFAHLRLHPLCLDHLEQLDDHYRGRIEHLWLNIELNRYTCRSCRKRESLTLSYSIAKILNEAITRLFSILTTWREPLTLELNAYCPSDSEHWFKNSYFGAPGEDKFECQPHSADPIHDPEHGWSRGRVTKAPPDDALRRPFGQVSELKFRQSLPSVHAVIKFVRVSDIGKNLPESVKKVTIFEDFNENFLELFALGRGLLSNLNPERVRLPYHFLGTVFAARSRQLEHLSVAFIIDARHFFDASQPNWRWPQLQTLTLTARAIAKANARQVNKLLQTAAQVALNMPELQTLTMWHGERREACAFTYRRKHGSIYWQGTRDVRLESETLEAWEKVAVKYAGRVLTVDRNLFMEDITSHGDAVHHLESLGFEYVTEVTLWREIAAIATLQDEPDDLTIWFAEGRTGHSLTYCIPFDLGRQYQPIVMFSYNSTGGVLGPAQIRLLHLLPAPENNDSIESRLEVVALEENPMYEALSYCWGDSSQLQEIKCNNEAFQVTENLLSALQHLRNEHSERTLWIDAICINQKDLEERQSQVKLMKDLYTKSQRVVIWLGPDPASDGINHLFELIPTTENLALPHISKSGREFFEKHVIPAGGWYQAEDKASSEALAKNDFVVPDPAKKGAVALLKRPWWSRVWTVQEMALAPSAIIMCGDLAAPVLDVSRTVGYIMMYTISNAFNTGDDEDVLNLEDSMLADNDGKLAVAILRLRRSFGKNKELAVLLHLLRWLRAKDPRDKVYGSLGIATSTYGIEPDYTISIVECYARAAFKIISGSCSLEIFSTLGRPSCIPPTLTSLPSWVPDWSYDVTSVPDEERAPSSIKNPITRENQRAPKLFEMRDAFPEEKASKSNIPFTARLLNDGKTLILKGVIVDELNNVGEKLIYPYEGPRIQSNDVVMSSIRNFKRHAKMAEALGGTIAVIQGWQDLVFKTENLYTMPGETRKDAFLTTILSNRIRLSANRRHVLDCFGQSIEGFDMTTTGTVINQLHLSHVRYLCLVPWPTRSGDRIALLQGGKTPYVLRKAGEKWKILGDCYVHGIMSGEAWSDERSSAWGIHHDEELYPNGYTFDPFASYCADAHTMITPSQNYVPFGIGKFSCPGRQFAAVVTEVFLAYWAMNYDLEEVHEKPRFLTISLANRVGHDPSKPTVIGLYGLPATGKSTVLEGLRNKLGETEFAFLEGSDVISYLVPGGLKAFQKLEDPEKKKWRAEAITHIKNEAAASGKIAVVTGHFMFWSKEDSAPYAVYTPVMNDKKKRFDMTSLSAENWVLWQTLEVTTLRYLCRSIVDPRRERRPLKKYDATNKAASNILMSPMRSAAVSGPMLREAHANVGRYLATEYVSKLIGLEGFTISHVQGHQTTGHRLRNEAETSIIALMRGGKPVAFGISDVFPQAMFVHASSADDVKKHHVQGQSNVILVDSVIDSGKSVIELIKRVVRLEPNISITVVAGVVQTEAITGGHLFAKVMRRHGAGLIALRISENKFTGTKTTDTGNRLFNTTRLA
ncbi:heterokaryon incompatibility protein-domain-containing protein [Fusarium oxysporum]|nr:heterokaryon incompatibility protein-domain-containing protein [Fusarium oxysporum]